MWGGGGGEMELGGDVQGGWFGAGERTLVGGGGEMRVRGGGDGHFPMGGGGCFGLWRGCGTHRWHGMTFTSETGSKAATRLFDIIVGRVSTGGGGGSQWLRVRQLQPKRRGGGAGARGGGSLERMGRGGGGVRVSGEGGGWQGELLGMAQSCQPVDTA